MQHRTMLARDPLFQGRSSLKRPGFIPAQHQSLRLGLRAGFSSAFHLMRVLSLGVIVMVRSEHGRPCRLMPARLPARRALPWLSRRPRWRSIYLVVQKAPLAIDLPTRANSCATRRARVQLIGMLSVYAVLKVMAFPWNLSFSGNCLHLWFYGGRMRTPRMFAGHRLAPSHTLTITPMGEGRKGSPGSKFCPPRFIRHERCNSPALCEKKSKIPY